MALADAEKSLQCGSSTNLSYFAKAQALYSRFVITYIKGMTLKKRHIQ